MFLFSSAEFEFMLRMKEKAVFWEREGEEGGDGERMEEKDLLQEISIRNLVKSDINVSYYAIRSLKNSSISLLSP